jgi:hypothetical protein
VRDFRLSVNDMRAKILSRTPVRAKRYPVHLPIYYREPNSPIWYEGRTENVSHTRIQFLGSSPLRLESAVELRLKLDVGIRENHPAEVLCRGTVVRVEQSRQLAAPTALTVAIERARIVRRCASPESVAQCA